MQSNIFSDQSYLNLLEEKNKIKKELEDLKKEYQENTIICSMNDMKLSNEIQQKSIDKLKNYIREIHEYSLSAKIMTTVAHKDMLKYSEVSREETAARLEFIIDILEVTLKPRSQLLYIT